MLTVRQILGKNSDEGQLWNLLRMLNVLHEIYLYPLSEHVRPHLRDTQYFEFIKFEEGYCAVVTSSLSGSGFAKLLGSFLRTQGSVIFGLDQTEHDRDEDAMDEDEKPSVMQARNRVSLVIRVLGQIGLGGNEAQRIFAETMSELLTTYINSTYTGKWSSPSNIPTQLRSWVEDTFARFIVEVLALMEGSREPQRKHETQITHANVARWQQRAICDLGNLRLRELFDVIVDWDRGSQGAIEDLKQYIVTTPARSHLTTYFSSVISNRLLQPGASTTEILQVYVCIIRAFAVLDPKGVLLDRIARPIRRYLRDRDDTVKIIVGGLLADPTDDASSTDALVELALELSKITNIAANNDDDGDLDWDDMTWLPDPVDAGPGTYRRTANPIMLTLHRLPKVKGVRRSRNPD